MAKKFKSKRKLRKLWILKSIFLIILAYVLIKLCIYSLVDISPISYFKIETVGHEFYQKIKDNTINNPVILLNYKGYPKVNLLPVTTQPKEENKKFSIYIYNTHQKEGYATKGNVFDAAHDLKKALENELLEVVVEEGSVTEFLNANNYDYRYSYVASRYFIEEELGKRNYDLVIDLHRDAISKSASTATINGKKYAKILFVVGKEHKNYKKNQKLAESLNKAISSKYPTLTRGVLLREGKNVNGIYNQDLNENMILLELGANYNTYEEVQNTIHLIAPIIGEYIYGKKV